MKIFCCCYFQVCIGTGVGFGLSGSQEYHYKGLKERYTGCTHVDGNLEITNLENTDNVTYDLSFLSQIEVVTGYVLIGLLNVETIPLHRLTLIRADSTFNVKDMDYGLVVAATADQVSNDTDGSLIRGLVELQLPDLRGTMYTHSDWNENICIFIAANLLSSPSLQLFYEGDFA